MELELPRCKNGLAGLRPQTLDVKPGQRDLRPGQHECVPKNCLQREQESTYYDFRADDYQTAR